VSHKIEHDTMDYYQCESGSSQLTAKKATTAVTYGEFLGNTFGCSSGNEAENPLGFFTLFLLALRWYVRTQSKTPNV